MENIKLTLSLKSVNIETMKKEERFTEKEKKTL